MPLDHSREHQSAASKARWAKTEGDPIARAEHLRKMGEGMIRKADALIASATMSTDDTDKDILT